MLLGEQVVEPAKKQAIVTHLDYVLEGASVCAGSLMQDGKTRGTVSKFDQRSENNPDYRTNCYVVYLSLIEWQNFTKPYTLRISTVIVRFLWL